jgi:hypothetical protein
MSFFASGMGAWIVYGTTEMGATPALSWWGVCGYSAASAFACLILYFLGPLVKRVVDENDGGEKGFGITDFGLLRYGRVMQLYIAVRSLSFSSGARGASSAIRSAYVRRATTCAQHLASSPHPRSHLTPIRRPSRASTCSSTSSPSSPRSATVRA